MAGFDDDAFSADAFSTSAFDLEAVVAAVKSFFFAVRRRYRQK